MPFGQGVGFLLILGHTLPGGQRTQDLVATDLKSPGLQTRGFFSPLLKHTYSGLQRRQAALEAFPVRGPYVPILHASFLRKIIY